MEALVDEIVTMALEQAGEIAELDGPRAEAWASDLVALARESLGPGGVSEVVDRVVASGGDGAVTILLALEAISVEIPADIDPAAMGTVPPWAGVAGTSACVDVHEIGDRRGRSLAFRFADAADIGHTLVVDIEPTRPESVGEVQVAGAELLDAVEEEGSGLEATIVPMDDAADRVARALSVTEQPRRSAVVNGQLLVARLGPLTDIALEVPEPVDEAVPPPPERDPEDAAYAVGVFDRALGGAPESVDETAGITEVAARLRADADRHGPLARWLAASEGPVDLDEDDQSIVVAAVAATIAPRTLEPLTSAQRDAAVVLEWADWLGALIELCREGPGAETDAGSMVDRVNRCPEVTTDVAAADRERVEWAFSVMTDAWAGLGVTDRGNLTEIGAALLPSAVRLAWAPG